MDLAVALRDRLPALKEVLGSWWINTECYDIIIDPLILVIADHKVYLTNNNNITIVFNQSGSRYSSSSFQSLNADADPVIEENVKQVLHNVC